MPADANRDYRLINASIAAMDLGKGRDQFLGSTYYERIGLKGPPQIFTGGLAFINAAFLGETTEGHYILAFRGTLGPNDTGSALAICADWTQDLKYDDHDWMVDGARYGTTASGFSEAVLNLWHRRGVLDTDHSLADAISGLDWSGPSDREFWITGHSKGGAMAVLTASMATKLVPAAKRPSVTTFGAPRVGKDDFVRSYNNAGIVTLRYQNQRDVIPMVPSQDIPGQANIPCPAMQQGLTARHDFSPVGGLMYAHYKEGDHQYVVSPGDEFGYVGSLLSLEGLSGDELMQALGTAHDPKAGYLMCFNRKEPRSPPSPPLPIAPVIVRPTEPG